MSRIGLKLIDIPEGVEVKVDGSTVSVKGPKGELSQELTDTMGVNIEDNVITIERKSEDQESRSLHGATRSVISNMVQGVSKGLQTALELIGVGYRAQKQGTKLVVNAGYSHPVEIEQEQNIEFDVPKNTEIIVKGIDKERVGAIAANIRAIRSPEPYKGKGDRKSTRLNSSH